MTTMFRGSYSVVRQRFYGGPALLLLVSCAGDRPTFPERDLDKGVDAAAHGQVDAGSTTPTFDVSPTEAEAVTPFEPSVTEIEPGPTVDSTATEADSGNPTLPDDTSAPTDVEPTDTSGDDCRSIDDGGDCPFVCVDDICTGECKPGAVACQSPMTQQECSDDGAWAAVDCPYVCEEGSCVGECKPGEKRCLLDGMSSDEGTSSQSCDERGKWQVAVECEGGCSDGQCAGPCDSEAPSECVVTDAEYHERFCKDGEWETQTCEFICESGACTGECLPGARSCSDDGIPQVCAASAVWERQAACAADAKCGANGECISPPQIHAFGASQQIVGVGSSTTLSWMLGGSEASIAITPEPASALEEGDTTVVVTPSASTTYTLTATNEAGEATATVRVTVASTGSLQYVRHFGAVDGTVVEMAVDSNGRPITLLRHSDNSGGPIESSLSAHDAVDGKLLPETTMATGGDYSRMALDAEDNVYLAGIAGHTLGPSHYAKFNSELRSLAYEVYINYAPGEGVFEWARDIVVAGEDVVAVAFSNHETDCFLWRVNTQFDPTSRRTANIGTVGSDDAWAMAADANGSLFVVGRSNGVIGDPYFEGSRSTNLGDAYVAKYSLEELKQEPLVLTPTASLQTVEALGSFVSDVAVDSKGEVLVAFEDSVAKYSNNLQVRRWVVQFQNSIPFALAVDDADNVIVAGTTTGNLYRTNAGETDVFVTSLSGATGADVWQDGVQLGSAGSDAVAEVASDSAGNVYVVGTASAALPNSVGSGTSFLMRLR